MESMLHGDLTEVTIPASVVMIGSYAFSNTRLTRAVFENPRSNAAAGEEFLRYFKEMSGPIKKFNELYWDKLLDRMIVAKEKKLTAVFVGGYTVKN